MSKTLPPQKILHIPRELSPYIYDASDHKALVVTLHSHLTLIKACLSIPFLLDSYYTKNGEKFKEHGYDGAFYVQLSGTGTITCKVLHIDMPKSETNKNPSARSFYLPVKGKVPKGAHVRIDNTASLATGFAKVYNLKTADEIIKYTREKTKSLN